MNPILRCIWCLRDTKTSPCEHCGSDQVVDRTKPHKPHWSRKTLKTIVCKVCGRVDGYERQYVPGDICQPKDTP